MKCKMTILLPVFLCFFVNSTYAQKRIESAINKFSKSEFILQFRHIKAKAEKEVYSFKAQQMNYDRRSLSRVIQSYNATSAKFNQTLREITNDLKDKQLKSPYIKNDFAHYKLNRDIRELHEFYNSNFVQVLADVRGTDGSAFLIVLPELAQLLAHASKQWKHNRSQRQSTARELIEMRIYKANRFRSWDEIEINGNEYSNQFEPNYPPGSYNPNPNPDYDSNDEYVDPYNYDNDYPTGNDNYGDGYDDWTAPSQNHSQQGDNWGDEQGYQDYPNYDPNEGNYNPRIQQSSSQRIPNRNASQQRMSAPLSRKPANNQVKPRRPAPKKRATPTSRNYRGKRKVSESNF